MPISDTDLQSLADHLESGADEPLTGVQRAVLIAALEQLAADESLIRKQARLLSLRHESAQRIAEITAEATTSLQRRIQSDSLNFDFDAASRARADLAIAIEQASSGRHILDAVLGFARDAASALT